MDKRITYSEFAIGGGKDFRYTRAAMVVSVALIVAVLLAACATDTGSTGAPDSASAEPPPVAEYKTPTPEAQTIAGDLVPYTYYDSLVGVKFDILYPKDWPLVEQRAWTSGITPCSGVRFGFANDTEAFFVLAAPASASNYIHDIHDYYLPEAFTTDNNLEGVLYSYLTGGFVHLLYLFEINGQDVWNQSDASGSGQYYLAWINMSEDNYAQYKTDIDSVIDSLVIHEIAPEPPPTPVCSDKSIVTARAFADYFAQMLYLGRDLTGDENAIESWQTLMFDFFEDEGWPLSAVALKKTPNSENLYQFQLTGERGLYKGRFIDITVYINMQGDEPWFFCPYTRYYPYVKPTLETYLELIAEGDVGKLAAWLSVDGGSDPGDDFIGQAQWGMANYGSYDLDSAWIESVRYIDEQQLFRCTGKDAQGGVFWILLKCGDGLIIPVSPSNDTTLLTSKLAEYILQGYAVDRAANELALVNPDRGWEEADAEGFTAKIDADGRITITTDGFNVFRDVEGMTAAELQEVVDSIRQYLGMD